MRPKRKRSLEEYLNLPYRIELQPIPEEDGGGWEAAIPQLGRWTMVGAGETPEAAIQNLREVKITLFTMWLKEGLAIPDPEPPEPSRDYNGRILVRTTPQLHRLLAEKARMQGVSLNLFVNQAINFGLNLPPGRSHAARRKSSARPSQ